MNASEKNNKNAPANDTLTKANAPRRRASSRPTRQQEKRKRRDNAVSTRKGTKAAKILTLLKRPAGASLKELRKATGWQAHSVRGYLSGALKKKMGLCIDSIERDSGERAYHVAPK